MSEPACTLDCGPGGSCYIELTPVTSRSASNDDNDDSAMTSDNDEDVDDDNDDDDDDAADDSNNLTEPDAERRRRRRRQSNLEAIQRCQCPLGRGGDRCQHGKLVRSFCLYALPHSSAWLVRETRT